MEMASVSICLTLIFIFMESMFYIQVIYENQGDKDDILPHLVYVAREKRLKINHHYKAGAMNVMVIILLINYCLSIFLYYVFYKDRITKLEQ